MNKKETERAEAIAQLRTLLKPGDEVQTILRHCSKSGMQRCISPIFNGSDYSWLVARATGDRVHPKHGGIVTDGCGMDMGFSLVYNLGRVLFPDGFGIAGKLPSGRAIRPATRAAAAKAVERGAVFYARNRDASGWDTDGGYALNQRWL